ncbi:hypothetical protein ACTFIR_003781 [Dictyostelium discoideum]
MEISMFPSYDYFLTTFALESGTGAAECKSQPPQLSFRDESQIVIQSNQTESINDSMKVHHLEDYDFPVACKSGLYLVFIRCNRSSRNCSSSEITGASIVHHLEDYDFPMACKSGLPLLKIFGNNQICDTIYISFLVLEFDTDITPL